MLHYNSSLTDSCHHSGKRRNSHSDEPTRVWYCQARSVLVENMVVLSNKPYKNGLTSAELNSVVEAEATVVAVAPTLDEAGGEVVGAVTRAATICVRCYLATGQPPRKMSHHHK